MSERVVFVRRSFLLGAGLSAVGFALGLAPDLASEALAAEPKVVLEEHPSLFVQIAPDGGVKIV